MRRIGPGFDSSLTRSLRTAPAARMSTLSAKMVVSAFATSTALPRTAASQSSRQGTIQGRCCDVIRTSRQLEPEHHDDFVAMARLATDDVTTLVPCLNVCNRRAAQSRNC